MEIMHNWINRKLENRNNNREKSGLFIISYALPMEEKKKDDELIFIRTTLTKAIRQSKIAKETVKAIQRS